MGEAQLHAGRELIGDIMRRWGELQVLPHSALSATACPGKNFPLEKMLRRDSMIYEKLGDVPEYYRPTIELLMGRGALIGTGGESINVDETYCRVMTTLDRLGKLR